MTHHMGKVNKKFLYHFLNAAVLHQHEDDSAQFINNYLIANDMLPPNQRADTGQPEIWRDYQQLLGDLGLIFSTRYMKRITPTRVGLAYLDNALDFSDVLTLQTFRYQYPNGHRSLIQSKLKKSLRGTSFEQFCGKGKTLTELQATIGVQVRPAILIWRVLQTLRRRGEKAIVTVDEIRRYLLPCIVHDDLDLCVEALVNARNGKICFELAGIQRDVQEWIRILVATPYFKGSGVRGIGLSQPSIDRESEIDKILSGLEQSSSFWQTKSFRTDDLISWYDYFGSLDLGTPLIPLLSGDVSDSGKEVVVRPESDSLRTIDGIGGSIKLREFSSVITLPPQKQHSKQEKLTIDISYDAELLNSADRAHDSLVKLIAEVCRRKGARVMEDPGSVDLLVQYEQSEFIVEVKSVTFQNFIDQLRYAIGQVSQYGYIRSQESSLLCRKAVALAAELPMNSWCIPFLNEYLDIDLISLSGRELRVHSLVGLTNRLFSDV